MSRPRENPVIPFRRPKTPHKPAPPPKTPPYADLQCVTNFSFLRGASHPGELVIQAKALGHAAIGIADRNTLAGIVRAHTQAKQEGLRLLVGARIDTLPHGFEPRMKDGIGEKLAESKFADAPPGFSTLVYPENRAAYGRLCRLLTRGKTRAPKGECHLRFEDIPDHAEGQVFITIPPIGYGLKCLEEKEPSPISDRPSDNRKNDAKVIPFPTKHNEKKPGPPDQNQISSQNSRFEHYLEKLIQAAPGQVWLAAHTLYTGDDRRRLIALERLATRLGISLVATNDVHYHHPDRRPLQDVISCIREKCTIANAGFRLMANAERHLKPPEEMARLFARYPQAIAAIGDIIKCCNFTLDELSYHYPNEPVPPGRTPQEHLTKLTWDGAKGRYPDGIPNKVRETLIKEFRLIKKRGYAQYFLTVHDIVAYARKQNILCQGRGSAANSAVCYCLGVTAVDPSKINLLFERFLSEEREEPPDIDVDFEHERREEVIQYVYKRYGRHRAALTATTITYRPRSAVREVGKVMGLTEDVTTALASTVWGSWGKEMPEDQVKEAGLDLDDPHLKRTIELTEELLGFPRHLSQHVGGFVLTEDALEETVPIGNAAMDERTFIEWNKDDIDELRIMKVDVLALGMLTCIRKCFDLLHDHYKQDYDLASVEQDDGPTYEMLQRGDSLGVFQVESRAQMNMLPRLKPRNFYDLVIEVAIVRPGPIQGDMVHPYLRRRDGIEDVVYPEPAPEHGEKDELEKILGRTLGVPIFQEQAMQIAIDAAKFSADEANQLRRAMATFRSAGTIHTLEEKMVGGMIKRGYDPDFARNCFNQIKGFGDYGFPESHAASFALLVYISSWIKCHYPDVFCAALLNSQPMGFYAPAQIVRDAREHGMEVRPVDINWSDWDNILEENHDGSHAVRLGFRQVDGLSEDVMITFMERREVERKRHPVLQTLEQARRTCGLTNATLERLAATDALRSMGLDRRQGLWAVRGLMSDTQLPLFETAETDAAGADMPVALPAMRQSEHVVADYQTHRLSLKAHPLSFLRKKYCAAGMATSADLFDMRQNQRVSIGGVILVRQKPGTAKGVCFMTIEDETGIANIVIWSKIVKKFRKVVMSARLVKITGVVQRKDDIIHVVAQRLDDLTPDLDLLSDDKFEQQFDHADHIKNPLPSDASGKSSERKHRKRSEQSRTSNATNPPRTLAKASRWRHPRNVRVIPKSRDFH